MPLCMLFVLLRHVWANLGSRERRKDCNLRLVLYDYVRQHMDGSGWHFLIGGQRPGLTRRYFV
jgi:hypothetical protein